MTTITQRELAPGVINLILNRPEKGNALDASMISRFSNTLDRLSHNPELQVLIISANGKHFCTGADLTYMKEMINFTKEENIADAKSLSELFLAIYHFPKPTIVAVHGATYGGGLGIIAASDIAIAADDSVFCLPETKHGLIPATISPFVINAIGTRQARRFFLSGERFYASQAMDIGLVHEIVPAIQLRDAVLHMAEQLLKNGPHALEATKKLVNSFNPINEEMLDMTANLLAETRTSEEAQQRLKEFLATRHPE